ncbi:MAG: NADP-dependent isocitrate dehydrogenase, partial [Pseudomonadota bacterium]
MGDKQGNPRAAVLSKTLDQATARFLEEDRSPSRKSGELDNRGSHVWLARYWAEELANQDEDQDLKEHFQKMSKKLEDNADQILQELIDIQGQSVDIDGYYYPDAEKIKKAMRPSDTLNAIIDEFVD